MHITRSQIIETIKTHVYVYGDDYRGNSYKGQASVACGVSNCFAVPTKFYYCTERQSFFYDNQFDLLIKPIIDERIDLIRLHMTNKTLVIFPKIGCGCSKLNVVAPKTYAYLQEQLTKLCMENI